MVEEYDVDALEETRAMMNADRGSNPKLTLLPFLITAMSRALAELPMLNATYDDEANVITRHGAVHMGVATPTPNGLMVPVIRGAQSLSVWQLASEIVRLAELPGPARPRARSCRARPSRSRASDRWAESLRHR